MSAFVIDYDELVKIATHSNDLAKKASDYANDLTRKVAKRVETVAGGMNGILSSAKYYVETKVAELEKKKTSYENLAKDINHLIATARRVDKEVATAIANNQETFLKSNEHLRIADWKADLINWLTDLKNSCPLFEMIGNIRAAIENGLSSLMDNIKHWWKCEGGKEIIGFIAAIGGAIIAVALFIATLPASGFFAICAAIGACLAAINAITNVVTSCASMIKAINGDPAWAKIYGDQNKLSDWLRQTNFKSEFWNRTTNFLANTADTVQLFCDVVCIGKLITDLGSKFNFIHNFFNKNTGLLSYMKTPKWVEGADGVMKMSVNNKGVVDTHFTLKSVWNGTKAFVMNKPIDAHTDLGIRTLLKQNFVSDFKTSLKTTFSVTAWKDTFKYNVTDGGRVSFDDWKKTYSLTSVKDTIRYNFTNNPIKGVFAKGVEWENRRTFITKSANLGRSFMDVSGKFGSMIIGEYNFANEFKDFAKDKVKDMSDIVKIKDKIDAISKTGKKINFGY